MAGIMGAFAIGFFVGAICIIALEEMRTKDSGVRKSKEVIIDG